MRAGGRTTSLFGYKNLCEIYRAIFGDSCSDRRIPPLAAEDVLLMRGRLHPLFDGHCGRVVIAPHKSDVLADRHPVKDAEFGRTRIDITAIRVFMTKVLAFGHAPRMRACESDDLLVPVERAKAGGETPSVHQLKGAGLES